MSARQLFSQREITGATTPETVFRVCLVSHVCLASHADTMSRVCLVPHVCLATMSRVCLVSHVCLATMSRVCLVSHVCLATMSSVCSEMEERQLARLRKRSQPRQRGHGDGSGPLLSPLAPAKICPDFEIVYATGGSKDRLTVTMTTVSSECATYDTCACVLVFAGISKHVFTHIRMYVCTNTSLYRRK